MSVLVKKIEKSSEFGKIRFLEQGVFIRKKRLQSSRKHLCKSWRAQNMPVVADRIGCYVA